MLLKKLGSFSVDSGAAGTQYAITGVGFTPKAVIFWWLKRTETGDTLNVGDMDIGMGFAIGSAEADQVSASAQSVHGSAAATGRRSGGVGACITINGPSNIEGNAFLDSLDADGFTIEVFDAFNDNYRIHYLAIGGDEIEVHIGDTDLPAGVTGSIANTAVGFEPDFLLFIARGFNTNPGTRDLPASSPGLGLSIGMATPDDQCVSVIFHSQGQTTMRARSYTNDEEIWGYPNAALGGVSARASLASFDANGFTVNVIEAGSTGSILSHLAIKGGKHQVGTVQTRTDTTPFVTTGAGFTPALAMFISNCQAESVNTALENARLSIGAATELTRVCVAGLDKYDTANQECATAQETDEVYINISTSDTIDGLMDFAGFNGDGVNLVMDNADPSAAMVGFWLMGSSDVPLPTKRGVQNTLLRM